MRPNLKKRAYDNNVNYQERAAEFSVGDIVVPYGMFRDQAGRVTSVWPAIGMVDVETPTGNRRFPVEDLQRFSEYGSVPSSTDSAPVSGMVSVPGGPFASRVASAYGKMSLYWADKDRRYRMSRSEIDGGCPCCPRCEGAPQLKRAVYKRRDGSSTHLLGCPQCMFLIKETDILNHPSVEMVEPEVI